MIAILISGSWLPPPPTQYIRHKNIVELAAFKLSQQLPKVAKIVADEYFLCLGYFNKHLFIHSFGI